jgi:hypothetical protein
MNPVGLKLGKKVRERTLKEIGASASGILLMEQSTPRHKDLEAGIWMRAVRRADRACHRGRLSQTEVIHRYSPHPGNTSRLVCRRDGNHAGAAVAQDANHLSDFRRVAVRPKDGAMDLTTPRDKASAAVPTARFDLANCDSEYFPLNFSSFTPLVAPVCVQTKRGRFLCCSSVQAQ